MKKVIWVPSNPEQALSGDSIERLEHLMGHPLPSEVEVGTLRDARAAQIVMWAAAPDELPQLIKDWNALDRRGSPNRPKMVNLTRGYGPEGVLPYEMLRDGFRGHACFNLTGVMSPLTLDPPEGSISLRTYVLSGTGAARSSVKRVLAGEGISIQASQKPGVHAHAGALIQATSFLTGILCTWTGIKWIYVEARHRAANALLQELLPEPEAISELLRTPSFLADYLHGVFGHVISKRGPSREHKAGWDLMEAKKGCISAESPVSHRLQEILAGLQALHGRLGCPGSDSAPIWNALLAFPTQDVDPDDSDLAKAVDPFFPSHQPENPMKPKPHEPNDRTTAICGMIAWIGIYVVERNLHRIAGTQRPRGEPTRATIIASVAAEVFNGLAPGDQAQLIDRLRRGSWLVELSALGASDGLTRLEAPNRRLFEVLDLLTWRPKQDNRFPILRSVLTDLESNERARRRIDHAIGG